MARVVPYAVASLCLGGDGELRLEIGESQKRGARETPWWARGRSTKGFDWGTGWAVAATFMQGAILIGDKGEAEDAGSRAVGLRTWDWRAARHAFCTGAGAQPGCSWWQWAQRVAGGWQRAAASQVLTNNAMALLKSTHRGGLLIQRQGTWSSGMIFASH